MARTSSSPGRWLTLVAAAVFMIVTGPPVTARQGQGTPRGILRGVTTASRFDISPPLATLAAIAPPAVAGDQIREVPDRPTGLEGPLGPQDTDPLVQSEVLGAEIPAPLVSFDGPPNVYNVSPPDPVGDVGPNHYVAMSNLSFQIFAKNGTSLFGPVANNVLWAGFGGDCETDNSGDPIVLHDQLADRWILTQFTASGPTYFNCVAVSQTADPTGAYYRYAFSTGTNFPDYPKYGIWPDALYISTREFAGGTTFAGIGAYAVNRAQLIAGNPSPTVIAFLVTPASAGGAYNIGDGLLPTDLDGSTLPPAGRPNFFVGTMDNGGPYGAPQDALTLWKFTANFASPASSSFVLANTIPVAAFDSIFPCTPGSRDCIPQPGTANKLDIQSYRQRSLHRLAYRNFGTHESLVTNQSVEAATGMAGIRWWEVRSPNSSPVLYQEGTYAPGVTDTIHRWMGSIAMDFQGNMALGYSASNGTTTFPSVLYTGRLATDPLGTMPQGEASIVNGTGSQTGSQRWGDYSSMNVDPSDDCTFWYVNEYLPTTSSVGWRLRIGSFKFPSCSTAPVTSQRYDNNTPLPIPDSSTVESSLAVSGVNGALLQARVLLHIIHTFDADLDLSLIGPDGTIIDLSSDNGGGGDNYGAACAPDNSRTTFDDTAGTAIAAAGAPFVGSFRPEQALAAFNGKTGAGLNGTWRLRVADDAAADTGTLQCWSLQIVSVGLAPTSVNDNYATTFNTPLTVPAPGVLTNDAANGGGAMTAQLVTNAANGTVALNADGSFTYTPTTGFVGNDSFTYRAINTVGTGSIASVSLAVAPPTTVQPPYNLYASSVAGNVVTLRWDVPAIGPQPTDFILEGGVNPGEVLASIPTGSDAPIYTFVAPTGSFYVRMHGVLGADKSAASNEIRIHVNAPVVPAAPANLVGLVNGSNLALAWWNNFAGGAPTSLLLDVTGSIATTLPLPLSDSFSFAGVPAGTYTLRLRAVNTSGVSDQSNPVTLTFPGACSGPPLTPASPLVYKSGSTIYVVWDPNVSGPAPTSYVVNVSGAYVGAFPTTARALSGAAAPGMYNITVTSANPCGFSVPTSVRTVTIP